MKILEPTLHNVIKNLRPTVKTWDFYNNNFTKWEDPEGSLPPTGQEIELEIKRLMQVWHSYEYAIQRKENYEDIENQLDMLFHDIESNNLSNGKWVNHIRDIKKKFPKPN